MQVIAKALSFGSIEPNSYDSIYRKRKNYNGEKPDSKIIKSTKKYCPPKADIADIGAGDGRNTIPLGELGHNVDAFEISQTGREIIQTKAQNLPNVNVSGLDILRHQPPKSYDEIFMSHISQHFNSSDMNKIFQNVSNALKKGGIFIFDALIDKVDNVKANTEIDEFYGYCHFKKDFIEKIAEINNLKIIDTENFREKESCRGQYYGTRWGFGDYNAIPLKLKWFTLKKL